MAGENELQSLSSSYACIGMDLISDRQPDISDYTFFCWLDDCWDYKLLCF